MKAMKLHPPEERTGRLLALDVEKESSLIPQTQTGSELMPYSKQVG
jgi:hypothetical protein